MTTGFFELALVVCLATLFGFVARAFKQPLIVAYLATGLLVGGMHFFGVASRETLKVFSDLGVMFLLFLVGLEINYSSLRFVGRPALIIGLAQVGITSVVGFLIVHSLGFNNLSSFYIGVALSFSSTVVVVKLLTDRRDLESLYGKLSVGMLLVQDVVALLILTILTGLGEGNTFSFLAIGIAIFKASLLLFIVFWMSRKVFPLLVHTVGSSQELLFLSSIAWLFIFAAFVNWLGFSIEIAGFLAGLSLANSFLAFQIANRIRPLRDFFMVIFFVMLGSSLVFSDLHGLGISVILLSFFVLVGNPLIVLVIMGLMGYSKRTSFFTGITAAQISEFSLILAALGFRLHHLDDRIVALITAVGIITIILSTYAIVYADAVFGKIAKFFVLFDKRRRKDEGRGSTIFKKPIVLIGYHRTGRSIAHHLRKEDLLVVDFDPVVFEQLRAEGYACIFGDIGDSEVFEKTNLKEARLIISTVPGVEDDILLLRFLRLVNPRPKLIVRAETEQDALVLYEEGADYVLLPHISSGHHLGKAITTSPIGLTILNTLKEKDLEFMSGIKAVVK